MPLLSGKANIGKNIRELKSTGRPHKQALAIALQKAYGRKRIPSRKKGRSVY